MTILTDAQINLIITAREAITTLPYWDRLESAVRALDELLRDVEPGRREDVDKLLGRDVMAAYHAYAQARYQRMCANVGGIDPLKVKAQREAGIISAAPCGNYDSGVGMGGND